MGHIHAEIQYLTDEGYAHSDLCSDKVSPDYRRLLHRALDEFLDKSTFGDGESFHVGDKRVEESRADIESAVGRASVKYREHLSDWIEARKSGVTGIERPDHNKYVADAICDLFEVRQ